MATSDRDYIRIEAPRLPEFVAVVRRAVEVVAARAGLPSDSLTYVRQALGEACSQAVAAAPYQGPGDVLRLSCSRHPHGAGHSPAIHLFIEAPQALFFPNGPAGSDDTPADPADAVTASVPFSGSLVCRLMERAVVYHTKEGTAVSFISPGSER